MSTINQRAVDDVGGAAGVAPTTGSNASSSGDNCENAK